LEVLVAVPKPISSVAAEAEPPDKLKIPLAEEPTFKLVIVKLPPLMFTIPVDPALIPSAKVGVATVPALIFIVPFWVPDEVLPR
jgi:hypothetical protein